MDTPTKVHISTGNAKLGPFIQSVNLPVGSTCRPDAPCYRKCYARKGNMAFPVVKDKAENNLRIWRLNPSQYEQDIYQAACMCRFFRWHSSGDIPDASYLHMMFRVARKAPKTSFLVFTKKWELVNNALDYVDVPENLRIVLSAWGEMVPINPHILPMAYIRFKGERFTLPDGAIECPRYCGDCVQTENNCWHLKSGGSVCFDEH